MNEATIPPMPSGPPTSKHKPDKEKIFISVSGTELKAHIFFPKNLSQSDIRPAFVFFHPGGWTTGEPEWGNDLCHHFFMNKSDQIKAIKLIDEFVTAFVTLKSSAQGPK